MPKQQKKLLSQDMGRCPNPLCKSKHFTSAWQFQGHLGQKPECRNHLTSLRHLAEKMISAHCEDPYPTTKPTPRPPPVPSNHATLEASDLGIQISTFPPSHDDNFPPHYDNDTLLSETCTPPTTLRISTNYEQWNFNILHEKEIDNFILNKEGFVFTNNRRVEITLLKILLEIEAPLWAFQDVMLWALDAYQTRYEFSASNSYTSQVKSLEQWVGMSHMRPNVVEVKLPGV